MLQNEINLGSNVDECLSGHLHLSRSVKPMAMNVLSELLIFLVMDPLMDSDLLERG